MITHKSVLLNPKNATKGEQDHETQQMNWNGTKNTRRMTYKNKTKQIPLDIELLHKIQKRQSQKDQAKEPRYHTNPNTNTMTKGHGMFLANN